MRLATGGIVQDLREHGDPIEKPQHGLCLDCDHYGFGGSTGYGTGIAIAMHAEEHPGHRVVVAVGDEVEWEEGGVVSTYVRIRFLRRLAERARFWSRGRLAS